MATLYSEMKNYLRNQQAEIEKLVDEKQKLEEEINSSHVSHEYKQAVIIPQLGELRHRISEKKIETELEAKKMSETVKENIKKLNDIKGEELTDDARLFSCGIKLTTKDIESIIDRNSNNQTMIQLALRYAEENGLGKINRVLNTHRSDLDTCDEIFGSAKIYIDHWIDLPVESVKILDKFFPEEGVADGQK